MPLSIKPHISYLDKSFKESHTRSYFMAMQLNLYGFSFAVFHPEKEKLLSFQSFNFDEKKSIIDIPMIFDLVLNKMGWFAYPYQKVIFLMQNPFYTFVPLPLLEYDKKNLYLGFNQPFQENHRIVVDNLKNVGIGNVYYLSNPVAEKVKEFWPNINICHYTSGLIEGVLNCFKNNLNKNQLFIDVHDENYDILYFKENKLFYLNNFSFKSSEDFIYFLLSTIEQLKLNPETVQLELMGKIERSDKNYEMIYHYIRNSSFISPNESVRYTFDLDESVHHKFFTLLNTFQCEL